MSPRAAQTLPANSSGEEIITDFSIELGQLGLLVLTVPDEPEGMREEIRAHLVDLGVNYAQVLESAGPLVNYLWKHWEPTLTFHGFGWQEYQDVIGDYKRELWLWAMGERTFRQFVTDLEGRLGRRANMETGLKGNLKATHKDKTSSGQRNLSHLDELESHAIYVMREVAAECERPALLFSGGKDSAVLLRIAEKAFRPARFPFPIVHVDTGHNFPEVISYRDSQVDRLGEKLIVASVQRTIDLGRVTDPGPGGSRNRLQSVTLLDTISDYEIDGAIGGARRDEDKARAKERVLSFRDALGQWDPRNQRPELWNLYQGRVRPGEHLRAFPLSDWTELDVWQYIARENIELPSIYFAHTRTVGQNTPEFRRGF